VRRIYLIFNVMVFIFFAYEYLTPLLLSSFPLRADEDTVFELCLERVALH